MDQTLVQDPLSRTPCPGPLVQDPPCRILVQPPSRRKSIRERIFDNAGFRKRANPSSPFPLSLIFLTFLASGCSQALFFYRPRGPEPEDNCVSHLEAEAETRSVNPRDGVSMRQTQNESALLGKRNRLDILKSREGIRTRLRFPFRPQIFADSSARARPQSPRRGKKGAEIARKGYFGTFQSVS